MSEFVTVCLITYERTEYAIRVVEAVGRHLVYPNWGWYMADDGSREEHYNAVGATIERTGREMVGWHSDRISYGAGANRALATAFQKGDLVLMLEDDWELSEKLDVWKYAALLMERPDIGMVRMGYLNKGLHGVLFGHNSTLYWTLNDEQSREYSSFAFAGHPALIHRRLFESYGYYPERWQPGETELKMCWQVSAGYGPKIVWPAELRQAGPWGHIGGVQSYEWNGGVQLG